MASIAAAFIAKSDAMRATNSQRGMGSALSVFEMLAAIRLRALKTFALTYKPRIKALILVFMDVSALHDETHIRHDVDIFQGIFIQRYDIGKLTFLNGSNPVRKPK